DAGDRCEQHSGGPDRPAPRHNPAGRRQREGVAGNIWSGPERTHPTPAEVRPRIIWKTRRAAARAVSVCENGDGLYHRAARARKQPVKDMRLSTSSTLWRNL